MLLKLVLTCFKLFVKIFFNFFQDNKYKIFTTFDLAY